MEPPVQMGLGVAGGIVRKISGLPVPQVNKKSIFLKYQKFISGNNMDQEKGEVPRGRQFIMARKGLRML